MFINRYVFTVYKVSDIKFICCKISSYKCQCIVDIVEPLTFSQNRNIKGFTLRCIVLTFMSFIPFLDLIHFQIHFRPYLKTK